MCNEGLFESLACLPQSSCTAGRSRHKICDASLPLSLSLSLSPLQLSTRSLGRQVDGRSEKVVSKMYGREEKVASERRTTTFDRVSKVSPLTL